MAIEPYFARQAFGNDRIDALSPLSVDRVEHTIHVVLQGESEPVEVILIEELSEPLRSACSATAAGRVRTFALVSVTSP